MLAEAIRRHPAPPTPPPEAPPARPAEDSFEGSIHQAPDGHEPRSLFAAGAAPPGGESDDLARSIGFEGRTLASSDDLDEDSAERAGHAPPVVMLCGVAYKYREQDLIGLLDQAGLKDMYDWVYVPAHICRHDPRGKGYAFVGLKHPSYIAVCHRLLDGKKLGDAKTNKLIKVKRAFHGPRTCVFVGSGSGQSKMLAGCADNGSSGQEAAQTEDMQSAHPLQGESLPGHSTLQTRSAAGTNLTQLHKDLMDVMEVQLPLQARNETSSEVGIFEDGQLCPPHANGNDQVDGCLLVVRNIPSRFMRTHLMRALDQFGLSGTYNDVQVPLRRRGRRPSNNNYGVVSFKHVDYARVCYGLLTGVKLGYEASQHVVQVEFVDRRLWLPTFVA